MSTGTIPAGQVRPNTLGSARSQNLNFAINYNTGGVVDGTLAANQVAAAAVTTGMVFFIGLADLGSRGENDVMCISAMINSN